VTPLQSENDAQGRRDASSRKYSTKF